MTSFESTSMMGSQASIARLVQRSVIALAIVLSGFSVALAQTGVTSPTPVPQIVLRVPSATVPAQNQGSSASIDVSDKSASAKPAYLTSVHGLQGVLVETADGASVAAQSVDEKFNPASSVKLATTLVALKTYGPDYRFVTSLWINGTIDRVTGTLHGDLIISGCDPSLNYEQGVMLARDLNGLGIETVVGNLIVVPAFRMNFDWSARGSGQQLYDTMDSSRRPTAATRAWIDERTLVGDKASLSWVPSVAVLGGVSVGVVPAGATPLLIHKSSRLVDVLKAMLCYSNNFMAERIGEMLGGPEAVRAVVTDRLKINPEEFMISSTSGLGVNRVTPRAMMTILRGLQAELSQRKLSLSDILPVAGIDPGTLKDRYTSDLLRGSVIAKTGTLVHTDGGASALVGQTRTRSGQIVFFVIMNQRGNVLRFRENQDEIVSQIQNAFGGPAAFDYHPVTLAIRLSDHDYQNARSRGEYEPKN